MGAFDGKRAVVTGASRGIGEAIALALAAEGASLLLVARDGEALEAVAIEARKHSPSVVCCPADLTRDRDLRAVAEAVAERGGLDMLVHCAGVYGRGAIESTPVAELDRQYQSNVRAPYALTQQLLPRLLEARGQVVFVNSSVVKSPGGGVSQFAATQHALRAIADALREEVNAAGVRVLSVFPGRTATGRQRSIHEHEGRDYHPERLLQPEDVARSITAALALPETAELTNLTLRPMLKPAG